MWLHPTRGERAAPRQSKHAEELERPATAWSWRRLKRPAAVRARRRLNKEAGDEA
jgi:hypothetical protein